jgi:UDP-glucose 4-epimerase
VKILVTGGAGFIGSHLVRRLVRERVGSVAVLDNFHRGSVENLTDSLDEIRLLRADLRNSAALCEALRGIDLVYHLAAQSSVLGSEADPDYTFQTNVLGTFDLLRAARTHGVRRVVFTSSREVYGDPIQLPVPESALLKPKNLYGASKVGGEAYCSVFGSEGLETAVLRLANVYGTGDTDRVIPLFVERALQGRPLVLYGGQQVLDFVWIDTVVESLWKVGFGDPITEPVNVGSGQGVTISNLSERVLELTGWSSTVKIDPARQTEVTRFVADVTRSQRVLDLDQPADPLFGLAEMVDWSRRQRAMSNSGRALAPIGSAG